MNKKYIIILIMALVLIISILLPLLEKKEEKKQNSNDENVYENLYSNTSQNSNNIDNSEIDKLKENNPITADSNLYEINTEYDGRKVLNIKRDIQYKVAFAGIIEQDIPQLDNLDNVFYDNYPTHKGIWVDEQSRAKLFELINSNLKSKYKINEEGYLLIETKEEQNENDRRLEKLINTDNIIILTVNGSYYEVDTMTGEIVEYPFEKLDNYQAYDMIESKNDSIIVITSNSKGILTNKEIIEEVLKIEI